MAVPTGKIKFSDIIAEFGQVAAPAKPKLSHYVRGGAFVPDGAPQNAAISPTSSGLRLNQFKGAVNELLVEIAANVQDLNLLALYTAAFGAPVAATMVRFRVKAGVIVGGWAAAAAIVVGQFPNGSRITIENLGHIVGRAGQPNGGAGGDAIKADYPNQTVIIENKNLLAGGGGAGGLGGAGGTYYYTCVGGTATGGGTGCGNAPACNSICASRYGGSWYCYSGCSNPGCCALTYCCEPSDSGCAVTCCQTPSSYTTCTTCAWDTTCSAAGGAGGNGGRGAGWQSGGGVVANASGNGGSNPGNGGGTGGTGGTGGGYGTAGNTGGTGGNSSSGHGGAAGGGGGAAGKALIKGNHDVTITNTGTVHGATNG